MIKYFFDVRNDSDALFAHFGITLTGVRDIQLQELASRYGPKIFLNGLAKRIERDSGLSWSEKRAWQVTKDAGVKLFAPEHGGTREVINERPLPELLAKYCAQDVKVLPRLAKVYEGRMSAVWKERVGAETEKRLRESRSVGYQPNGRHKALGPGRWY